MSAPRSPLSRLSDLPVMVKILSAVLVTLVVGVAVGVLALTRLSATSAQVEAMYAGQLKPLLSLADASRAQVVLRLDLVNIMIDQDQASMTKDQAKLATDDEALKAAMARYSPDASDPGAVAAFDADYAKVADFRTRVMVPLALDNTKIEEFQKARDTQYLPLVRVAEADITRAFDAEATEAAHRSATAKSDYRSARTLVIAMLLLGSLLALGIGIVVARQIRQAVARLGAVAGGLAKGDLRVKADISANDELGKMAAELDAATATLRETVAGLEQNAVSLAGASEELSATSGQIAAAAEETGAQAGVVSSAASQVSSNIATVATSSEEMRASIQEIAGNSTDAAAVAQEAVRLASDTNHTIMQLGTSSAEIGDVVKTIASIAEQTNLLALNATIEAARAGEAGKGFAVVANEVKELAQETARATEDIGRRVDAIQNDTRAAVDAIERITSVIGRISDFQATIASAVEEQTATTSEVVRNVAQAAAGAEQIAQNVSGVADAAQTTTIGVTQAQSAAAELSRMSADLQRVVSRFQV